jgi:hypothetical protein
MAYYTKEVMSITKSNTTLMIISALTVSLFLAAIGTAQMSSAQTNKTAQGNQTTATVTGKANATIVNKTTVPAEQTTVTVNQTSKSVGQGGVKQAQQQPAANISSVKNQTMVKPAGKATTTIVNKTNVPFNQTTVTTGNETTTPTSPASQANQSAQSQGNQSTSQNKPAGDVLGQLGKGLQNLNPFKK